MLISLAHCALCPGDSGGGGGHCGRMVTMVSGVAPLSGVVVTLEFHGLFGQET